MTRRYVLAWFPMIPMAVANGLVRDATYGRLMPEHDAHQLSVIPLLLLFAAYVAWLHRKWPLRSSRQALAVGAAWLVLTVGFEFGLGLATGDSWEELLAAYDLLSGSLWPLVPAGVALLPALAFRLLGARAAR